MDGISRTLVAAGVAVLMAFGGIVYSSGEATAHQAPCETTGPGHSSYAQHHIVPLAKVGGLGAGGHVPGSHHGYAGLCGVHANGG